MIGQKQAVIQAIQQVHPTLQVGKDNALLVLSPAQLEQVKTMIVADIANGNIEYSKNKDDFAEVRTYGRSMVMNHIKKAKELNGGTAFYSHSGTGGGGSVMNKAPKPPKDGIDRTVIPQYLADFVGKL